MRWKTAVELYRKALAFWFKSWIPAFAVAIVVAGIFIFQMLKLVRLQDWLDHTDQAIGKGLLIQKLILDAETGIRGYLLARDAVMLNPYYSQNKVIDATILEAKAFVADNRVQIGRLERLSSAFGTWRIEATRFLDQASSREEARAYFGNGGGRSLIDRCRKEIDDFLLEEQRLRSERSGTLRIAIPRTIAGGAALTLFLRLALTATLRVLARRRERAPKAF